MKPGTRNYLYKTVFASLTVSAFALLAGCGGSSGPSATTFTSGQAASVVIGQPDFVSNGLNQGGTPAANTLSNSFASAFVGNGVLLIPDENNNRTLVFKSGIPTTNDANADYAIGQADLVSNGSGTSATSTHGPEQGVMYNGKWIQTDYRNNRVLIYNSLPTSGPGTADVVVGQANMTSSATTCDNATLYYPESVAVAGGKLIVTDGGHNRVLIWNSIPTANGTAADVVLGQADFVSCSANAGGTVAGNTFYDPAGMWTDGTRLAIDDSANNRILIWNSIPTADTAANVVLGQTDLVSNGVGATSATTLNYPYDGIWFNSSQFVATDEGDNRVLIWNSFPTTNGQAADVVLGEPDMTTSTGGTSSTLLSNPNGVFLSGKQLIVSDTSNHRTVVFNGK